MIAFSGVAKRSITVRGQKTSISLEDIFWNSLKEMAAEKEMTLLAFIDALNNDRPPGNLSSHLRQTVVQHYRDQAK